MGRRVNGNEKTGCKDARSLQMRSGLMTMVAVQIVFEPSKIFALLKHGCLNDVNIFQKTILQAPPELMRFRTKGFQASDPDK